MLTEQVQLQLWMEFIDPQRSEDLKSKFLACHILDFYNKQVLRPERFTNLITQWECLAQHTTVNSGSPEIKNDFLSSDIPARGHPELKVVALRLKRFGPMF